MRKAIYHADMRICTSPAARRGRSSSCLSAGRVARTRQQRVPAARSSQRGRFPGELTTTVPAKPSFFIVGAPKCGTTALYAMLGSHPDVFVSPVKEPDFLANDLRAAIPVRPTSAIDDHSQYQQLFAGAGQASAVGEGSVSYLSSATAPAALHDSYPCARIIMVLRDPASKTAHYDNPTILRAVRQRITDSSCR